jgi:hypothetical protein
MLTVTESAGALLTQILDQEGLSEDIAIRLVCEDEGLAMQADNERPGDNAFQYQGRTVLVLDKQISELLAENSLDADGDKLMLTGEGNEEESE